MKEARILSKSHDTAIVTEEDKYDQTLCLCYQSISSDSKNASLEGKIVSGHYLNVVVTEDTDSHYILS